MTHRLTQHTHINSMIIAFEEEQHHFSNIHRLIDIFETIIKTHTALIIANYFLDKDISEQVKALLPEGEQSYNLYFKARMDFAIQE